MNASKMKNIVVLKDLPSNIVEEAYVILKPNININKKDENLNDDYKDKPCYIIEEAEMIINNYISKIEDKKSTNNTEINKIKRKYYKLKKICMILGAICVISLLIQIKL